MSDETNLKYWEQNPEIIAQDFHVVCTPAFIELLRKFRETYVDNATTTSLLGSCFQGIIAATLHTHHNSGIMYLSSKTTAVMPH